MCAMHNADDVSDWMVRKGLQAKLESVMLTTPVKDKFFDGSSGAHQVDHEEELYQPIASAIYEPVNRAACVLGFRLVYTMSRGMLFGDNVVLLLPVNVCLHPISVFSSMSSLCLHELASTTSIQHVIST